MNEFSPAVHTVTCSEGWAHVCDRWPGARDPYVTKREAEASGREQARQETVDHIVRDADRTIEQGTSIRNLLPDR